MRKKVKRKGKFIKYEYKEDYATISTDRKITMAEVFFRFEKFLSKSRTFSQSPKLNEYLQEDFEITEVVYEETYIKKGARMP